MNLKILNWSWFPYHESNASRLYSRVHDYFSIQQPPVSIARLWPCRIQQESAYSHQIFLLSSMVYFEHIFVITIFLYNQMTITQEHQYNRLCLVKVWDHYFLLLSQLKINGRFTSSYTVRRGPNWRTHIQRQMWTQPSNMRGSTSHLFLIPDLASGHNRSIYITQDPQYIVIIVCKD